MTALDHRLQCWEDFLVSQISCGAEEHQGIGMGITHRKSPYLTRLPTGSLLQVSTEAEAHRREQFVLIIRFTARSETLVERGGEYGYRHGLVDGRLDRPAALARV